jgi:hypothetical protein
MQRMAFDDPDAFVTLTRIHDPSSFGVTTKMQVLDMVLAGINQEMSGKPPFIKSADTSILAKKYRFIEFFVPGIIAMAVMTASLFGAVNVNASSGRRASSGSCPPPPSPVPTGSCRTSCTSSSSRWCPRL